MSRNRLFVPLAVAATASAALAVVPSQVATAAPDGSGLVISEAYVNGGSTNATYTNKFVEIHNPTDAAIDLTGMSLQYRPPTNAGNASNVVALSGSVPAGGYFLFQGGSNGANGAALPAPDQSSTSINPGGGGGTLFIAGVTTAVDPDPADGGGSVVDLLGWGTSNRPEGIAATGNSVTASYQRTEVAGVANADSDNNSTDFVASLPTPDAVYVEPEPPEELDLTIAQIQGSAMASEHVGVIATTSGVVTAAYPSGGLFGFYLQTPGTGGVSDPATRTGSDAVFVRMTQAAGAVTVQPGQHVEVTGAVVEFAGQTQVEVTAASDVSVLAEGAAPVTATTGPWPTTPAQKESLEGMLYAPTGDFTVSNTYNTNQFGEVGLAQGDKPLIQPTEVEDAQGGGVAAVVADNAARAIVLDDGSSTGFVGKGDLTPPYISHEAPVSVGAAVTFTAPVVFTEGGSPSSPTYRFQPTQPVIGPGNTASPATFENLRTVAPDEARINADGTADLKVASFNVLNYFTTLGDADDDNVGDGGCVAFKDRAGDGNNVDDGCNQRGAWDPQDLARQQAKIVAAINALDADVVGLMEIENSARLGETADEATNSLVAALNAAAGAGTWAANPSSSELPAVADQDVITNAIIYKPAAVTRVGEARALGTESGAGGAFSNAREPIGQAFQPVGGGEQFLYVVNHFKSKGSGADDGTGQGNANPDRIAQAGALATWVADVQTQAGVDAVLLGGDFNSYTMEDPLQVLYAAGFVNATSEFGDDEWSYSFQGLSGSLDHILMNQAARDLATGSDVWNINAGESLMMEYSRWNYHATDFHRDNPFRSSDHDPVVVGLDLAEEPAVKVTPKVAVKVTPKKVKVGKTRAKVKVLLSAPGVKVGGKVTIKVGGMSWTVALKNGKADVRLPAFKATGRKTITVIRAADGTFNEAKAEVTIKVVRR